MPPSKLADAVPFLGPFFRLGIAALRRMGLSRSGRPPITEGYMRQSVEQSLRRLGVSRIDILFLHEPSLDLIIEPARVIDAFRELKHRGIIRSFGVAGQWGALCSAVAEYPDLAEVVQTNENAWTSTDPIVPDITFGAITEGNQSFRSGALQPEIARQRLQQALARREDGIVLVSTRRAEHLHLLAQAARG